VTPVVDEPLIQEFCSRFGVDITALNTLKLWKKGKSTVSASEATCIPPPHVDIQTIGIPFLRMNHAQPKPTTAMLQRFGHQFKCHVVELDCFEQASTFLQGKSQRLPNSLDTGYVHVRYPPFELGCGILRQGNLISQIPKGLRSCRASL
jgi:NOL1/NOP2/fmu family ribosome biogenesis protein